MFKPSYISLEQARELLSEMGIKLTQRQMKRAAEMDAKGQRKLPFFVDPIEGKLKIEKGTLMKIYNDLNVDAQRRIKE